MICDLRCSVLFLCLYSSLKETRRGKNIHFFFSFFFSLDTPKGNLEPSPLCYVEFIPKFSESFDSFFRRSESFRKGDGAL